MEFKDLTPELQERLKACKTLEELTTLVEESGFELTDEELEDLAGGGMGPVIWTRPCPTKILDSPDKQFKKSDYLKNQQTEPEPADLAE